MNPSLDRLARDVSQEIDEELQRSGILYRIFSRSKTTSSIEKKLAFKNYQNTNKLMQDILGVRIAVYFADDLPIIYHILRSKPNYVDEMIDEPEETVFKPSRVNLIFRMNPEKAQEIIDSVVRKYTFVDTTYEVQLRTVLSEGWHEVEHDLRYKCPDDWNGNSDLARTFNGVYASLVTNDWSILAIFEQLAYRNYKARNWTAMLRNRFRLRFTDERVREEIVSLLNSDLDLAKSIFRIDRGDLLRKIITDGVRVPLSLSNLVFVINAYYIKDSRLKKLTPEILIGNNKLFKQNGDFLE
jgi:putative GTP pyrophosphokinase